MGSALQAFIFIRNFWKTDFEVFINLSHYWSRVWLKCTLICDQRHRLSFLKWQKVKQCRFLIFVFHLFTGYLCHLFITYRKYFTHKPLYLDYVSFCKFVLSCCSLKATNQLGLTVLKEGNVPQKWTTSVDFIICGVIHASPILLKTGLRKSQTPISDRKLKIVSN